MGFSPSQVEAIHFGAGTAMVLAGPGSGKTTVITHRVRNLIEEHHVPPEDILVITFTKAAAIEMEARFHRLMRGNRRPVTFGTFHAVFFHILKYAYNYSAANIVRNEQQLSCMKEILAGTGLEFDDEGEKIRELLSEISTVKGDGISPENYYSRSCPSDIFRQIYASYEDYLRRASLIDFDDMMTMCMELFTERKDILAAWQQRYRYILVDEFQDINRLQYEIVRMLAGPENNLFIVGDDDQSIYRFRGARPEIMLSFPQDYPDCHRILLSTNYRSVPAIVDLSGRLISHNQARYQKQIVAAQNDSGQVSIQSFGDLLEENEEVIRRIQAYHALGIPYEEIALLYRTNSNPGVMSEQMMRCNLPFSMNDVLPNLYEHWIARDLVTYMLIAAGSDSRGDYMRIINRPRRYISRNMFTEAHVSLAALKAQAADRDWIWNRLDRLEYDLKMIRQMRPWAAINYIRHAVNYDDFVKEYAEYKRIRLDDLMDLMERVHESALPYDTLEDWLTHIQEYTQRIEEQKAGKKKDLRGVQITTMHSSKGLEYRVVFLMDANEGVTPHRKAVLPADIEEERRLFYVAMTRAKTFLHISFVRQRFNREMFPSRFVQELGIPVEVITNKTS